MGKHLNSCRPILGKNRSIIKGGWGGREGEGRGKKKRGFRRSLVPIPAPNQVSYEVRLLRALSSLIFSKLYLQIALLRYMYIRIETAGLQSIAELEEKC